MEWSRSPQTEVYFCNSCCVIARVPLFSAQVGMLVKDILLHLALSAIDVTRRLSWLVLRFLPRTCFKAAYENRYTWDKAFPGYTADVTYTHNDQKYNRQH